MRSQVQAASLRAISGNVLRRVRLSHQRQTSNEGVQHAHDWGSGCWVAIGFQETTVYPGCTMERALELIQTRGICPLAVHPSLAENGFLEDYVSLLLLWPLWVLSVFLRLCRVTSVFHKQPWRWRCGWATKSLCHNSPHFLHAWMFPAPD